MDRAREPPRSQAQNDVTGIERAVGTWANDRTPNPQW